MNSKTKILLSTLMLTLSLTYTYKGNCNKVKEFKIDNTIKNCNSSILEIKRIAESQLLNKTLQERTEKLKREELEKIEKGKEILRKEKIGFDCNDITRRSLLKPEELYGLLVDRNVTFPDCAWSIIDAENIYGINAFVLSSIAILESQHGRSNFSKDLNNLTGYAAYDGTGTAQRFDSKSDGLYKTAKLLSQEYVDQDGMYYTGPCLSSINTLYSSSNDWYINVSTISQELLNAYYRLY